MENKTVTITGVEIPLTKATGLDLEHFILAKHESGKLEIEKARLERGNLALEVRLDREMLKALTLQFQNKSYDIGDEAITPELENYQDKIKQQDRLLNDKQILLNDRLQKDELKDITLDKRLRTLFAHKIVAPKIKFEDFEASLTPQDEEAIWELYQAKLFFLTA